MIPSAPDQDDRITCATCSNRSRHNGVCEAARRLGATRTYTPDPELPRRCESYLPKGKQDDMRTGATRWRLLPMGADPVEYNRRQQHVRTA